jgi:hypothetical protein
VGILADFAEWARKLDDIADEARPGPGCAPADIIGPPVLPWYPKPLLLVIRAVAVLGAAAVLLPYLLPTRFTERLTDLSVGGWVAFAFVVPLLLGPVALHQGASVIQDGDILLVPTTLGPRRLDLTSLTRVWARKIPGKGDFTQLMGTRAKDGTRVWFHWTDGNDTSERLAPLLRRAASHPGVIVSERARQALGLPEAPARVRRMALWLRGAVWYVLYIGLFVGGIILDVHLLVDRYVGYDFAR